MACEGCRRRREAMRRTAIEAKAKILGMTVNQYKKYIKSLREKK